MLAKHLITMSRYKIVERIAQGFWQNLRPSGEFPNSVQVSQRIHHTVRARQETLRSLTVIQDDVEGVKIERISAVPF